MNKKLLVIIAIISSLGLTACFGGDDTSSDGSSQEVVGTKKVYSTDLFSMMIPLDWEVIEKDKYTSNVPSGTVAAFVNNIKSEQFTANVSVHLTEFSEEAVELDNFATGTMEQARNTLTSFSEGNKEEIKISQGDGSLPGYLLSFSGKKSAKDPIIKWNQLVLISNNIGYTVSAAYLSDEDESVVKKVEEMLNSFELK